MLDTKRLMVTSEIANQLGSKSLANLTIVHINHLLNDILDFNMILTELGAYLIYVPVVYGQKELPAHFPYVVVYDESSSKALSGFDSSIKASIYDALVLAMKRNTEVLIIEDGGNHIEIIHQLMKEGYNTSKVIGAIEQTIRGLNLVKSYISTYRELPYPILSIARSKIKTRFENYFVARRIIDEISKKLHQMDDFLAFKEVVLIGYGIIGRSLALLLRRLDCIVSVLDKAPQVKLAAQSEGFRCIETLSLESFTVEPLIISTTGTAAFSIDIFITFLNSASKNLYLVSTSSKRIEYASLLEFLEGDEEQKEKMMNIYPLLRNITNVKIIRSPIGLVIPFHYQGTQKIVYLFAEGYPINLHSSVGQSLPYRVIDMINAEILILVQKIIKEHAHLQKKLYLLGKDELLNLLLNEDELMQLWSTKNCISPAFADANFWQALGSHPSESWLTENKVGTSSDL